jgi:hypothetical protein
MAAKPSRLDQRGWENEAQANGYVLNAFSSENSVVHT